jgi:excisionase family DNA binding protein
MVDREEMLDVRAAAALAGRHPETIRRWVWSGRLPARRVGNRLLVARGDVEALAGAPERAASLAAWAERARVVRRARGAKGSQRTAADLVLRDRTERSGFVESVAGR